jgi:hypothetical protein
MACITVPLEKHFKGMLHNFLWVNWSEVGREDVLKRYIFDKFIKTGKLSDEDNEFCDKIDWYPVDWLKLRKEYVEELKRLEKGPFKTAKRLDFWNE